MNAPLLVGRTTQRVVEVNPTTTPPKGRRPRPAAREAAAIQPCCSSEPGSGPTNWLENAQHPGFGALRLRVPRNPPDSPSTQPPSLRCHLTHAQIGRSGSPCIAHTMAMPKRQDASFKDGCHGSRRAVAGATDFAVALADRKKCPLLSGVGPDLPPWRDALGYTWLNKQLHRA